MAHSSAYVRSCLPESFREFKSTRVVIDATEFPVEKPSNPDVQRATWSNYKNRNTLKLLVGCSPNGVLTFVSDLYGGRISEKEITRRSGLLQKLEPGDSLMVDRGFDIDGMLPPGVSTNVPPFLGSLEVAASLSQEKFCRRAALQPSVSMWNAPSRESRTSASLTAFQPCCVLLLTTLSKHVHFWPCLKTL